MVQDGTKTQTVRAYRKDGKLPMPGEAVNLFTGMRTKDCQRIEPLTTGAKPVVKSVATIFILENGTMYTGVMLSEETANKFLSVMLKFGYNPAKEVNKVTGALKDLFAWQDGFRPAGSTADNPGEAFALMLDFWKQTHSLPFVGTITYW